MALDLSLFGEQMKWVDEGTRRFSEAIQGPGLLDPDQPSLLESWSIAHLVSHLNSNARALVNLTIWADTGVVTPMYASNESRSDEIEAGAALPFQDLVEDFHNSASELSGALRSLSPEALNAQVKSARGRIIPASETAWMRVREVWVHLVDLGLGASFSEFPVPLLDALLDDAASSFAMREAPPQVELHPTDGPGLWKTSGGDEVTKVEGPKADLCSWMLGRSAGEGLSFGGEGDGPINLPPWL